MEADRWRQLEELYHAALQVDPARRAEFIRSRCIGNDSLYAAVQSLAEVPVSVDSVFEHPAFEVAAKLLAGEPEHGNGSSDPLIGSVVGHFRILEQVGAGGMGVVYRALHLKLHNHVALKFLPESLAKDSASIERLRREARAAFALNHPNICTIHDIVEYEGKLFVVMELMEGMSLRERIAAGPLPIGEVLALGKDIASGLAAAHARGIIHRDIKPANLFITTQGHAKILDFGLAKALPTQARAVAASESTAQLSLTTPGAAMGTLAYMSPEQARGEQLDVRTDIFSFGATLYEMATGIRAFQGKSLAELHDAILNRQPTPATQVDPRIPTRLQEIIARALEKGASERYQTAVDLGAELKRLRGVLAAGAHPDARDTQTSNKQGYSRKAIRITAAAVVSVAISAFLYFHLRPLTVTALTDKDTVVLADFTNNTGEPVFDDALQQGLAVQLAQSPYLNILSEQRVRATLGLMKQPPSTRLTNDVAAQVCQRSNSTARIGGSISRIGTRYQLILDAVACAKGDDIARVQAEAEDRDHVLQALGSMATQIRIKLGELPASVKKYDVPMYEATTSSLDALKAFSLAHRAADTEGEVKVIALFRQATVLDPDFALAHYRLAAHYGNVGEEKLAAESYTRAYALRNRVSMLDNLRISAMYLSQVVGDRTRAIQAYDLWAENYPNDAGPHFLVANLYGELGQYDKMLEESRKAIAINPRFNAGYHSLAGAYFALNRIDEAKKVWEDLVRRTDKDWYHLALYGLAFYQNDHEAMAAHLAWGKQQVGEEDAFLTVEAETSAYRGHFQDAEALWNGARQSASRNGSADRARWPELDLGLAAAEFGMSADARTAARHALKGAEGPRSRALAALVLARAGDLQQSSLVADALAKQYPADTLTNYYWLPIIRASIALRAGKAQEAIALLAPTLPYEQAAPLYPIYFRGQAYLHAGNAAAAAEEFQKILDHRTLALGSPADALAQLWLGRALALEARQAHGNKAVQFKAQARTAYQNFLTQWKNADPNIPILKQGKAEYARLQ